MGVWMAHTKTTSRTIGKRFPAANSARKRRRSCRQSRDDKGIWEKGTGLTEDPNSNSLAGAKRVRRGEGADKQVNSHFAAEPSQRRKRRKKSTDSATVARTAMLSINSVSYPRKRIEVECGCIATVSKRARPKETNVVPSHPKKMNERKINWSDSYLAFEKILSGENKFVSQHLPFAGAKIFKVAEAADKCKSVDIAKRKSAQCHATVLERSTVQIPNRGVILLNFLGKNENCDCTSQEVKERKRKEKIAKAKRRCEERMPNFYVIEDPNRQRHQHNISLRKRECRRGTPPDSDASVPRPIRRIMIKKGTKDEKKMRGQAQPT
ncbi:hypothetical protein Aduo_011518 [Ancylostoma duodenale]